jgi:hypothetical protein
VSGGPFDGKHGSHIRPVALKPYDVVDTKPDHNHAKTYEEIRLYSSMSCHLYSAEEHVPPCSPLKFIRRFTGTVASIFRVEEEAKQETNKKQITDRGSASSSSCSLLIFNPENAGDTT